MATQQRVQRVREAIKQEASDIIQQMKDPRIGFVTVTDAEVSRDLRHVKIFVSVLGDEESRRTSLEGLERATGYIRSELGQRIRLRHTPEIVFRWDESLERGARISKILQDLREENSDTDARDESFTRKNRPSSVGEDA
ncbi:MAG: 30S ribosome-binding factor RbfA [Firmicutes bacterium]|jgi:ribosome-binding factor A|nr:30S ribosome-binding factor RbfA [Bacillota bacterium]